MDNQIQEHWKEAFSLLIELCNIKPNEKVVVLTETLSRQINISLVELVLKDHSLKFKKIEIASKPYSVDPIIRSTGASNILDFEKNFGNCEVFKLEKNYRSTGHILGAAASGDETGFCGA